MATISLHQNRLFHNLIPPSILPPLQAKGAADAAQAAVTVSGLELGGLVGGTLAGVLSDMRIRRGAAATAAATATGREAGPSKEDGGNVGRRVQIIMVGGREPCGSCASLRGAFPSPRGCPRPPPPAPPLPPLHKVCVCV